MAIQLYVLTWEGAELHVAIDHEVMTEDRLHEINDFWIDGEDRLDEEDGNVLDAVLKRLAQLCFVEQMYHDWNAYGLVKKFDWDDPNCYLEGWPKMDGSAGILIVEADGPEILSSDISVSSGLLESMPPAPKPAEH